MYNELVCSIVAVHDIESQWHSWKVTSTGLLWLPDLLLAKAPSARIMVYGYNPQVFVHNVVDEAASSLMYELVKNRQQVLQIPWALATNEADAF
jgi:hypothetical protein